LTDFVKIAAVPGVHKPIGRYVHAMIHNGIIYVSGCGPFDATEQLVGAGDVATQCRQTLANAKRILEQAGSSPAHVLRETVYLTDVESRFATRIEREAFYGAHTPASTLIGVASLTHPDMVIEMDFIAAVIDDAAVSKGVAQ
jgi:2-iminobutanoate/2-iminopropanoate deaminase